MSSHFQMPPEHEALALADPRGAPGMHAPLGSKFSHFHAVFGKKKEEK